MLSSNAVNLVIPVTLVVFFPLGTPKVLVVSVQNELQIMAERLIWFFHDKFLRHFSRCGNSASLTYKKPCPSPGLASTARGCPVKLDSISKGDVIFRA